MSKPIIHSEIFLNDTLPFIAEDYFQERMSTGIYDEKTYTQRLKKLRKTDSQIQDVLIELDDDYTKFQLHGMTPKRAKLMALVGFSIAFTAILIAFLAALGTLLNGTFSTVLITGIGTGLVSGLKGLNELKMERYRKERRAIKWQIRNED